VFSEAFAAYFTRIKHLEELTSASKSSPISRKRQQVSSNVSNFYEATSLFKAGYF
jgi:hypothetical protein